MDFTGAKVETWVKFKLRPCSGWSTVDTTLWSSLIMTTPSHGTDTKRGRSSPLSKFG